MGVGRNEEQMMHGVDKMDTEENSQEGKLEIWKEEGLGWCVGERGGLIWLENIMVLVWG